MLRLSFSSLATPPTTIDYNMATGKQCVTPITLLKLQGMCNDIQYRCLHVMQVQVATAYGLQALEALRLKAVASGLSHIAGNGTAMLMTFQQLLVTSCRQHCLVSLPRHDLPLAECCRACAAMRKPMMLILIGRDNCCA